MSKNKKYIAIDFRRIPQTFKNEIRSMFVSEITMKFNILRHDLARLGELEDMLYIDLNEDGDFIFRKYEETNHNYYVMNNTVFHPIHDYNRIVDKLREMSGVVVLGLNNTYKAKCTKDGIQVGCQTFRWEILDKLIAAKAKIELTLERAVV